MGIYTQLPADLTEVDVIITGGGTTSCIIASRISDALPSLSILLIEAGPNNFGDPSITNPLLFLSHLAPTSTKTSFYQGSPEPQLGGRELVVPSGAVLGGGSSINMMMYSRAQRSDWDAWQMPGWSASEMLPYLRKLETYHGPPSTTHGTSGPTQISHGTYTPKRPQDDFIAAAAKVGYAEFEDLQDLESNNGVQRAMRFIGLDGKRQDAANVYLHPRLVDGKHADLHVLVETQVLRVLFEGKRAVGVEVQGNPRFRSGGEKMEIKAKKMVIVSAGALGSPLILERSGVGDPDILSRAGVPVIAEVPGVGKEYQDHHLLSYPYHSSLDPSETADALTGGRMDVELLKTNASILGWNAQDITCKLRPTASEVEALGPEFKAAWNRDFKNNLNKPLFLMALVNAYPGDPTNIPPGQYLSITAFSVYPYSRGHIHITSPDPQSPIDFQTGFLKDPLDITKHVWAYKKQREIMGRMACYRGELSIAHPPFPPSSSAACISISEPLDVESIEDIQYSEEDEGVLRKWIVEHVNTTWHSLGTCKMGSLEKGGVVDGDLSVHGLTGLKVADLSIAPGNVAANTANTAFAVGEKAADIFIKELVAEG